MVDDVIYFECLHLFRCFSGVFWFCVPGALFLCTEKVHRQYTRLFKAVQAKSLNNKGATAFMPWGANVIFYSPGRNRTYI